MNDTPDRIAATIAALEAQRGLLGDVVVDTALAPLRHALAALQSATAQQLKQVSVLFVDVVGSTAIGQRLAPEDIHAVMDGALERFTAIVESHGGRVLQYTGDGMLAAFGTDASLEDDAESAVLAGLGILAAANSMAPRVRQAHDIPDFDVRAGIHTGTVLLGGGVDAEGSIRGSVVNVAARMEQSAPAGGLRISLATYRQVLGALDCEEQAPIAVKGVAAPVRSYLVRGVRPRALRESGRGLGGVHTPLIGRERELGVLSAAFHAAAQAGQLQAVTIVGDAGLGKTRLLAEFRATLTQESRAVHLLLGQAHPRSALQPYGMLRDLLLRQLDIAETDNADTARSRFVAGLAPLLGESGEAPAHLVGHLIGLDFSSSPHIGPMLGDAQRIREQAFAVVGQLVRRLAQGSGRPVVLEVLDDLHWADGGSLACARYLLQANRDTPLLLLFLTRPELFEHHADWADGDPLHQRLDLSPLDRDDSIRLAESLLQRIDQVPEALRALITAGAEGNPFYMEELVKMLLDDGVIVAEADGWRVQADRLLNASVPPTLTGVLQARLGALGKSERIALQHAAVIGQVFSDAALASLAPDAPDALPALIRKQLIVRRDGSGSDGGQEYAFKHNLLHQVAYDSVLKGPKQAGHRAMGTYWGAWAEVQSPQAVTPAACRALAEVHYHRCIGDPHTYVGWFDQQFYNYLNAYAGPTLRPLAEGLIGVCEARFGVEHAETAKALTNLARVCVQQGDVNRAEPLLRRAITIQEVAPGPDHPDTARTIAVLGGLYVGRGDHPAAEPQFRRALGIREHALGAEHPLTVGTLDLLASTLGELGRNDEAETLSRRVLEIRERVLGPDHPDTLFALTALGDVLSKKQDHAAAEPLIRRALSAQQRTLPAEHPNTGLSMWNLAEALRGLGRLDEAEPLARGSLAMWEKTLGPQHEWTAWSLGSLARLRLEQGDAADAIVLGQRALEIHERALGPAHATVAETLVLLGLALLAQGQHASARPLLKRALAIQTARAGAETTVRDIQALLIRARGRARAPATPKR